jgi:hypothetical protein
MNKAILIGIVIIIYLYFQKVKTAIIYDEPIINEGGGAEDVTSMENIASMEHPPSKTGDPLFDMENLMEWKMRNPNYWYYYIETIDGSFISLVSE